VFPKKTILANGQQVQANIWYTEDKSYIERAIRELCA